MISNTGHLGPSGTARGQDGITFNERTQAEGSKIRESPWTKAVWVCSIVPEPSHTRTHTAARTHMPQQVRLPEPESGWGLSHELIYFLSTSGIKGGTASLTAQLHLATGPRALSREIHPFSSSKITTIGSSSRTNHQSQGTLRTSGKSKTNSPSLTLG